MMISASIFEGEVIATIHGSMTDMVETRVVRVVSTFSSSPTFLFVFLVHKIHVLDPINTIIVQIHLLKAMAIILPTSHTVNDVHVLTTARKKIRNRPNKPIPINASPNEAINNISDIIGIISL